MSPPRSAAARAGPDRQRDIGASLPEGRSCVIESAGHVVAPWPVGRFQDASCKEPMAESIAIQHGDFGDTPRKADRIGVPPPRQFSMC